MIRKFAGIPGLRLVPSAMLIAILAGVATVHAQQTPAQQPPTQQAPAQQPSGDQPQSQQQPENQQPETQQPASSQESSSSQEASPDEIARKRRAQTHNYKNWTFNVGGGANLPTGTTNQFVRGGGGVGAAGVARNVSKYLGLRLDFQFDNLPLRTSALQAAQAPSANNHVYALMLDPIINIPVTKAWSGYVVAGPGFYHRSGRLDSSTAIPGSACNPFFTWWGHCFAASLPINGHFLNASQNQWGYNFGAGVARKVRSNIEVYAEFRYMHGSANGLTTDTRPITIGIRW
jgi:opacity protein-like surface antigen